MPAIVPFASRSGRPSARVDGIALHSPYDPEREARRFVEESLGGTQPGTVVVLGEGLGYASQAVDGRGVPVVSVCYSAEIDRSAVWRPVRSWSPASPVGLAAFLRSALEEPEVEGLRVIEWPASARLFPAASRAANEALRAIVRELNGSLATTAAMGRLWLRSAVWNLACLDRVLDGALRSPGRPVVVAASGPGLRRSLPALAAARGLCELWALPSAVPALASAGLPPDVVVLTDATHWAMVHLQFAGAGRTIAMPLAAARGAWRRGDGVFLIRQGDAFERELLGAAGIDAPVVQPHGTVAASALDLALASADGPVVLAGLDLAAEDSLAHTLPNAFDDLIAQGEHRLAPRYSALYERSRAAEASSRLAGGVRLRISRPLATYAAWLSDRAAASPGRVFRLLPSAIELPGAVPLDPAGLAALLRAGGGSPGPRLRPRTDWPGRARRLAIVQALLARWRQDLTRAAEEARDGRWREWLSSSSDLARLAWTLGAAAMLEARRRGRAGDGQRAAEATSALLADGAAFLGRLAVRLEGAS